MPVGAYGDIVVRENGRTSIPRKLHRWRPQIKIDTTFTLPQFLHLNATVTLLARATMECCLFVIAPGMILRLLFLMPHGILRAQI